MGIKFLLQIPSTQQKSDVLGEIKSNARVQVKVNFKGNLCTYICTRLLCTSKVLLFKAVKASLYREPRQGFIGSKNKGKCGGTRGPGQLSSASKIRHTIYTRNNMGQKCEGNCGLWVLNEILKKTYPENLKKNRGCCLGVTLTTLL